MLNKLVMATNNANKLKEVKEILSPMGIEVLSQNEAGVNVNPEENGETFEQNSEIKARAVYNEVHMPVIADDSGICVDYLDGKPVKKEEEMILLAFHKPTGIVCTAEKREKNNVVDYINYPKRIYPIGRLDKDSEGLLLMTNNGDIVNRIMRAGNMHEKEYIVTVNKPVTDSFLRGLAGGIPLVELNATTRKCKVWRIGKRQFGIILTQGLNRQIRRMCEYFGYRVEKLVRTRIMNIELGDLKAGTYRKVTPQEYKELMRLVKDSSNTTVIHGRDGGDR